MAGSTYTARWAPWSPFVWRSVANASLDFLQGMTVGIVLLVLLSLAVGLSVLGIGLVLLVVTLALGAVNARFSRARLTWVLGVSVTPPPAEADDGGSRWRQVLGWLTHVSRWKELLHGVLLVVIGPLWYTLVTGTWALALALLAYPAYGGAVPADGVLLIDGVDMQSAAVRTAAFALGVAVVFLAAAATTMTAQADIALARALLGTDETEELREQVHSLRDERAAVVDAADAERRRIERDLHDGVQPQLVSTAMNLGLAQRKFDTDPAEARRLVDLAHGEVKRAITDLRQVVRGVHPAVLSERGLDAAMSALAARSPVPVTVDVDESASGLRYPAPVEAVAYFVVAEALTNVARHSGATKATVTVSSDSADLVVTVSDDGHGGASPAPGSGLAGLIDRVAAVDGTLDIASPAGLGTTLTVRLPCAS